MLGIASAIKAYDRGDLFASGTFYSIDRTSACWWPETLRCSKGPDLYVHTCFETMRDKSKPDCRVSAMTDCAVFCGMGSLRINAVAFVGMVRGRSCSEIDFTAGGPAVIYRRATRLVAGGQLSRKAFKNRDESC